jgi:hypothetical protein
VSVDLAVWDGPMPSSDDEAARVFERLYQESADSRTPPNEPIRRYVGALLARFPDLTDLADDEVDESPWATGPLIEDASGRFLYLSMGTNAAAEEAWEHAIAKARSMGLVCLDPQQGALATEPEAVAAPSLSGKELCRLAVEEVATGLVKLGFGRRRTRFLLEVSPHVEASLSLVEKSPRRGVGAITPFIGVINDEVTSLLRRFDVTGSEGEQGRSVVSTALGYVMPEPTYRSWHFTSSSDVRPHAADIVEAVKHYGVPVVRDAATLDGLEAAMKRFTPNMFIRYRLPLLRVLQGRTDEARDLVRSERERALLDRSEASACYVAFADRFLAEYGG